MHLTLNTVFQKKISFLANRSHYTKFEPPIFYIEKFTSLKNMHYTTFFRQRGVATKEQANDDKKNAKLPFHCEQCTRHFLKGKHFFCFLRCTNALIDLNTFPDIGMQLYGRAYYKGESSPAN